MKKVLSIGGSDCSGGAGIQADLKTFAVHKTYGMSVITSLTSQNTMGITEVVDLTPEFVGKQLDAVFEDIYPDSIKIGMVSNEGIMKMVARKLRQYDVKNIVVDPVIFSPDGSELMDAKTIKIFIEEIVPYGDIITPDIKEASVLSDIEINNKLDMEKAAEIIGENTDGIVLIQGGALLENVDDLLYMDKEMNWIENDRLENPNTHGIGCTFSSAIAANLANEMDMEEAYREAKKYLIGAIKDGLNLGKGRGPLNHIYNI